MKLVICLGLFVLLAVSCEADVCSIHADGCIVPSNLPYFFKERFTTPCNQHDICYTCGHSKGWSRKECDDKFYGRLILICSQIAERPLVSDMDIKRAKFCDLIRGSYEEAIRIGGSSDFSADTTSWCSEKWVDSCL